MILIVPDQLHNTSSLMFNRLNQRFLAILPPSDGTQHICTELLVRILCSVLGLENEGGKLVHCSMHLVDGRDSPALIASL